MDDSPPWQFSGRAVDVRGDPVTDFGVAVAVFDGTEMEEVAERESILKDVIDRTEAKHFGFTRPRLGHENWVQTGPDGSFDVGVPDHDAFEFGQPETLLFAVTNDDRGRTWFGTEYFDYVPNDEEVTITVNKAHLGRAVYDTGLSLQIWRTASTGSRDTLNAEFRGFTDKGLVSFEMDENIEVDYDALDDAARQLDPNGKDDRYTYYVGTHVYHHLMGEYDNDDLVDNLGEKYAEWPLPVYPPFDHNEEMFTDYTPRPYDVEVPTDIGQFAVSILGFAGVPFLAALGWYFLALSVAAALFDPEDTVPELDEGDPDEPSKPNLNVNDVVPGTWERRTNTYVHRVPIYPGSVGQTTVTLRGRWRTQRSGDGAAIEGTDREIDVDFRRQSPLDAPGDGA